ncbi:MAG: helix-turn-helix transcriptional regulator [Betaproteobacteria bacterium]|nr:helix-turn-helix transcriptional regulator [Betaproteobacteria bacterium]
MTSDRKTSGNSENSGNNESAFERSCCPITNGLDIFGDKWTLLIIRDLMLGKRRYQDLIASPENIASNILADRLKRLQLSGLINRRVYQQNPERYEYVLTEKGRDLKPILEAIIGWGKKHYPDTTVFAPFVSSSIARR